MRPSAPFIWFIDKSWQELTADAYRVSSAIGDPDGGKLSDLTNSASFSPRQLMQGLDYDITEVQLRGYGRRNDSRISLRVLTAPSTRSLHDYCTVSVAVPVTPPTDAEIVVVPEATP